MNLIPRMTEKAYAAAQTGIYVFTVPLSANKASIITAVEHEYTGVKVKDVRTVVIAGKTVRATRGKRQNPGRAQRSDTKKAYVTLASGTIELFKEQTEEEKK